jgi:glycosyltransferase involved in cell wall biosynthesis
VNPRQVSRKEPFRVDSADGGASIFSEELDGLSMSKAQAGLISVVMPVHNALPYLDDAVSSILEQTFKDFEFVIFDDGSTDGSTERLQQWAKHDSRIRLIRGQQNLGPARSSNEVVHHASSPLIARMDADDVSYPDRLEKQANILAMQPDVGIIASLCEVLDAGGQKVRGPEMWRLTRKSWFTPFPHGSMMFRRSLYDAIGGYREECEFWEDLDFVLRASERSRILVIPRPLYFYRQSNTSTRIASKQERVEEAIDLRYRSIERIRQNRSYNDVLSRGPARTGEKLDPRVFISLGSLALWTERRPNLARRFLARARLGFNFPTLVAGAWVSWISVSPGSLRALMNAMSRLRNFWVHPKPMDKPVEWITPPKGGRANRAAYSLANGSSK